MSTQAGPARDIPRPIIETLRRVIFRARLVMLVRGLAAVVATTLLALLAVMAIDAGIVLFSARVRWALTGGVWVLTALAAAWFLVRPLARTLTLSGVARMVERHHPELQERISSAVELVNSHDSDAVRGSESLIRALVDEATADIANIRPRREVTFRAARPYLITAAAVLGALALLAILWPTNTTRLLARAVNPAANLPNVHADNVRVEPAGRHLVVRSDEPLALRIEVDAPKVRSVRILMPGPDGRETAIEANSAGGGVFHHTFPPRSSDYRFRVHAGDALTAYTRVEVVPPPKIERIDLRYEYPAYTGLGTEVVEDSDGRIAAVVGTEVVVTAQTNCDAQSAAVHTGGESRPVEGEVIDGSGGDAVRFRLALDPGMGTAWHIDLRDRHGFANPRTRHDLAVLPDLPPEVVITHPKADAEIVMRPDDTLPVAYRVRDDYGVADLGIEMKTAARELPELPVELDGRPTAAGGVYELRLGDVALGDADVLEFRFRAADAFPGEALDHVAYSRWRRIRIERDAPDYEQNLLREQAESIRQKLEALRKELAAEKERSAELVALLEREDVLTPEATEAAQNLAANLHTLEQSARELVEEMRFGAFAPLADPLERVADSYLTAAREQALQARLAEHQQFRRDAAREADFQADRALMVVDLMLESMKQAHEMLEREQQLADMAEQQQELADDRAATEAAQQDPEQQPGEMSEEEWRRRHEQIAEAAREMMEQMAEQSQAARDARELGENLQQMAQDQADLASASEQNAQLDDIEQKLLELAERQRKLQEEAEKLPGHERAAQEMEDAAESLENNIPGDAFHQQENAARALNDMRKGRNSELSNQQKQEAAELEKKQWELRDEVRNLRQQQNRVESRRDETLNEAMQREQEQIAREAMELAEQVAEQQPEQHPDAQEAAREANEAAQQMEADDMQAAAEHAREAARELDQLAQETEGEVGEQARDLAERQQDLAEQAAAQAQGDTQQAVQQRQEALQERTEAAAEQARELADQAPADAGEQVAGELEQAKGAQQQAGRELAQAEHAPAAQAQQQATGHLEQAARSMSHMARAMAQQPPQEGPAQQMSEAAQSTQQAAETAAAQDAQQAADALEAARRAAAEAARQQGLEPYRAGRQAEMSLQEPREGTTTDNEGAAGPGTVGLDEAEWGRLHELKARAARGGRDTIPSHYRALVREYYLRLSQLQSEQEGNDQ